MWHRFPQPFRDWVNAALARAAAEGHQAAQPMDFLRSVSAVPACSAAYILARLNAIDPPPTLDPARRADAISSETKRVFVQAYEESALLNDRLVGSDHFLLALLKLNEAPELMGKGVTYARVRGEIKRLRRLGFGPDYAIHPVNPLTSIVRTIKTAFGNLVKFYRIHVQLSAIHPKLCPPAGSVKVTNL